MGLDMYLRKKKYLGSAKVKITDNKYDWYKNIGQEYNDVKEISMEVGYWRKANQIHNWFVENVQDGNDDCGEYEVSQEKLEELLAICQELKLKVKTKKGKINNGYTYKNGKMEPIVEDGIVITNPEICEELLPTADGFFFGSTDYDQYYLNDIDNTIEMLTNIINSPDYKDCDYYYTSSW